MSHMSGRNKFQNKPTEAELENYEYDGKNEYFSEISREKVISGVNRA
jgi:hypothetical protein